MANVKQHIQFKKANAIIIMFLGIDNNVDVDYYALKLLSSTLKESDAFIQSNLPQKSTCSIF